MNLHLRCALLVSLAACSQHASSTSSGPSASEVPTSINSNGSLAPEPPAGTELDLVRRRPTEAEGAYVGRLVVGQGEVFEVGDTAKGSETVVQELVARINALTEVEVPVNAPPGYPPRAHFHKSVHRGEAGFVVGVREFVWKETDFELEPHSR